MSTAGSFLSHGVVSFFSFLCVLPTFNSLITFCLPIKFCLITFCHIAFCQKFQEQSFLIPPHHHHSASLDYSLLKYSYSTSLPFCCHYFPQQVSDKFSRWGNQVFQGEVFVFHCLATPCTLYLLKLGCWNTLLYPKKTKFNSSLTQLSFNLNNYPHSAQHHYSVSAFTVLCPLLYCCLFHSYYCLVVHFISLLYYFSHFFHCLLSNLFNRKYGELVPQAGERGQGMIYSFFPEVQGVLKKTDCGQNPYMGIENFGLLNTHSLTRLRLKLSLALSQPRRNGQNKSERKRHLVIQHQPAQEWSARHLHLLSPRETLNWTGHD
ncbi:putative signal peptide protein [Puccinia sorghi]|uniref:Putative signal peptide protein n=1 Tax=Puccinia sorghi TaxID=27349 RepID=A0A0L6UMW1_9BASI|nr:putative signal peptide protein [Puccinia sorghi]